MKNNLLFSYLTGLKTVVEESKELDRLKFMPQKVEGSRVVNFKGAFLTGVVEGLEDRIIYDLSEIMNATRCTPKLKGLYFTAYDAFVNTLGAEVAEEITKNDEPSLEDDLLDAVEEGNKKEVRSILKELKDQWFALDDDVVEDAIDDIKDCVATKDVKAVEVILDSLEPTEVKKEQGKPTEDKVLAKNITAGKEKAKDLNSKPKNEIKGSTLTPTTSADDSDTVLDIVDALKDEDIKDVEMMLKELGEDHPRYEEFSKSLATLKGEDAPDPVVEAEAKNEEAPVSEDDEIDAIIADLEDAIEAKEFEGKDGAKEILAELLELVGAEDEDYIKYNLIVNPPVEVKKELTRAERRAARNGGK